MFYTINKENISFAFFHKDKDENLASNTVRTSNHNRISFAIMIHEHNRVVFNSS